MTADQGQPQAVWLESSVQQKLGKHLLTCYPQEACGILLGAAAAGGMLIDNYVPMSNVAPDPLHTFTPKPSEWVQAQYNQPRLIGLFHTHPQAAPWPSAADLSGLSALSPEFRLYLIASPGVPPEGGPDLNAFYIERCRKAGGGTTHRLVQLPLHVLLK
ncbi:Mov34/MPN/PAD-1 family protein ['Paenibacillus yunnanensis' Narsing Rao et al. 2020]|uniref:Mov34/MPN/PAD-1 family protein n=1 Tax=Paenibacillus tengchongensis TaxID=2608684 RepID=UPI00124C995F|nr:M67 family metallopeptidase [Paenibacillus tengchongensis]